jgi:hypothetical protein
MIPWNVPAAVWFTVNVVDEPRKMLAVFPAVPPIVPDSEPIVGDEVSRYRFV